ncbi:Rv1535 domain-containing protein [Mycobacterium fragae]|uniref:Rv1535 domain-containing protein n=1 Tax=Mycobacterium fragae TaxID=1260918 RepID=UPI001FD421A8|nr:Rv1535 domain-containing protein [Mycobacterium fragae]
MSTTDALADPLAEAAGLLLTVPVIELYAVLWRLGFVEVVRTRQTDDRVRPLRGADRVARGLRRPPRRLPPRLIPAPAPSRSDQAEYSRAAG